MADPVADPVAVLVACDPDGPLLALGRCGALPPAVRYGPSFDDDEWTWRQGASLHHFTTALPLWWDGALVPEGWDRAWRVWTERGPWGPPRPCPVAPEWPAVIDLADRLVGRGLATRVVLLDRIDGRLVERVP